MMEQIKLDLDNKTQFENAVYLAAKTLKRGGVIIYPTDTLYGIGANAFNKKAVARIYNIKNQKRNKPISVIVGSIKAARKIACISYEIEKVLNDIWPGSITVVLRKKDVVPCIVAGNAKTVALRISDNRFVLSLAGMLAFPITATSANISGSRDLLKPNEIVEKFSGGGDNPDLFINSGCVENAKPSTIIDLTANKPKILRVGAVGEKSIHKLFSKFSAFL